MLTNCGIGEILTMGKPPKKPHMGPKNMTLFDKITQIVDALNSIPAAVTAAQAALQSFSDFLDTV